MSALADGTHDPKRQQPNQRGAAAEILSILPVEGPGVTSGLLGRRIPLGTAGAAAALAAPAHGPPFAGEAEAVTGKAAAQHWKAGYP
jgi:hypothetical protein